jgi:hypothetical protein
MDNSDVVTKVKEKFNGRDPLADAHRKMSGMDNEELISLVLIAANKIGTIMRGGDYEDAMDAAIHLGHGIEIIFSAYESAWMHDKVTTSDVGNA